MTSEPQPHPLRANFPQLTDVEFDRVLKTDEIVVALGQYLVQRGTDIKLTECENRLFERNPIFPFPVGPTALEIVEVALNSFGSFAKAMGAENVTDNPLGNAVTDTDNEIPNEIQEELHQLRIIKIAAIEHFSATWRLIIMGDIPERGPVADTGLVLRDALNPDWPNNSDWLPEPLASERAKGYPNPK